MLATVLEAVKYYQAYYLPSKQLINSAYMTFNITLSFEVKTCEDRFNCKLKPSLTIVFTLKHYWQSNWCCNIQTWPFSLAYLLNVTKMLIVHLHLTSILMGTERIVQDGIYYILNLSTYFYSAKCLIAHKQGTYSPHYTVTFILQLYYGYEGLYACIWWSGWRNGCSQLCHNDTKSFVQNRRNQPL